MNSTEEKNTGMHVLNIVMVWLCLATVALLTVPWEQFSPELAARVEQSRGFLCLALILELSNFLAQALIGMISSMRRKHAAAATEQRMSYLVSNMDFSERALVREFVLQRKSELKVPLEQPTVRSLLDSGILILVAGEDEKNRVGVSISRQARPFITYRAIGISAGKLSDEQINQLMEERPEYARPEQKPRHVYRSGAFKAA